MNVSFTNSGPTSEAPGRPCDWPGAHCPGPLDTELRTLAGPRKSGSDGLKGGDGRGAADRAPSGGRGALLQDWRTWGRQDADGGADGGGRRDNGFLEKAGG